MYHIETFHHTLPDGQPAKFSIWQTRIEGRISFYAKVIGTDLDSYTKLSEQDQELQFGVHITNGNQGRVYYTEAERLKADILEKYGTEWLQSEI